MRWIRALRAVVTATPLFGAACGLFFPAPAPMRTVRRAAEPGRTSRCLVVFLPGLGDHETDFVDHGFLDALSARALPVDAVAANATFGYYANRSVVTRLQEDVLRPARQAGYEQIWLVGISMGGLGALLLSKAAAKPDEPTIAGALLMAPYLGDERLLREIDGAGGLAQWNPGPEDANDYQREVWRFLKETTARHDREARPTLYLAAGDEDKLRFGHRLLAAALPSDRVLSTRGTHDWGPWSVLWADFLDRSDFRARCTTPG
jgi:pimeloyl-ACP methyl ester carboxylesterase